MGRSRFGTVRQTRGGTWWARYEYNGTTHRPGHLYATENLARGWLNAERRLIDLDIWTPPADRRAQAERAAVADSLTVGEFARDWISKRVTRTGGPLHPRTREDYLKYLDGSLADLAAKPVAALTLADVQRWWTAHGSAPAQRHKAHAFLKSVLNTAVLQGYLTANPCRVENATRKPRASHNAGAVVRWLNHERVLQLADLVQPHDRLLILLLAYCCLRTGEAFALRRGDVVVNLDGPDGIPVGWITVERGISTYEGQRHEGGTKTGELGNRVVPVPPHLVADIVEHLKTYAGRGPEGLLFPSTNPALGFRTASQVNGNATRKGKPGYGWYHAREVAGRPDAHLHDFRHWGATVWDEAGTPAGMRVAIMGHAQPGMTGHYTHPDTTKASPYAVRVSELAGWSPKGVHADVSPARRRPEPRVPDVYGVRTPEPVGALPAVLAALDDQTLIATLPSLTAAQLAAIVPTLPPARVALVVAALAGKGTV